MYALESEITQDGSRYMLNSSIYKPDYRRRTNLYCLSFAYMIDCPVNRCALNVMKESNIMTIVRKLKPDEWNHYRMTFSHRGDFRMQFMANFYENSSGMIALDEIEVHTGSCLSQPNDGDRHVCDFEYDDCGWIPYHDPTQPNFKFTWADALHPATKDHTTGRNKGMVAAVEIGPNQRIKSPVLLMNQQSFDYSDELCVAFWMNVNVRNLRISLQTVDVSGEQPRSRTWWSVADQPAIDTWIPYFAQIKSDSVKSGYIQFALESTLKEKATDSASIGFLALDDVNVQQGRCPKTCTFEDTNCEWHQIQPSEFKYIDETNQEVIESSLNANWLITNALRHPIEHDRFQKSRHAKMNFLRLVTAKESAETNSSGLLRSSVHPLDSSNALCISFKHVMIDPVFEVQVLLAENAVAVPHTLHRIRPASDESGTDGTWKTNHYEVNADYAVKKFGLTSTPKQWLAYILVSQTARENGTVHNTNFGLANLNIRAQPCGAFDNKFKCDQFRMIPYSKMCDFHYDCEDKTDELNCSECRDFSDGLCGYEIAEPDDSSSSWQLYQSKTNDAAKTDISIKPTTVFDASVLPSGGFLYTQLNAERYSKLIGPVLENAHGTCELIVRYAVLNAHFKIDVEVAGQTWKLYKDCDYLNDSLDNDQLDDDITVTAAPVTTSRTVALKEVRLQIGRIDDWFELEFYASRGPSTNSSQSIGGVLLAQSQLVNCFQPEPTEGECGPDQFRCKNRVCINRDLVCDLNDDCGDTSDETMCNRRSREQRCSFESGTCELIPISQFVRSKAVDSLKRGPTRDHTDNSATGHYLLYSPDRTSSAESAELALPVLVDSGSCAMRWFASGRNVASVRLRYSDNDANDRLSYELPIPSDNRWTRQQVRLRDLGDISPFLSHLQVTLIKNATGGAYFALDDFTLTDSCYPHMATEMVCRFGEDASNGLCAWHLNRRADNVLGEVIRTEQELTQIRTDQAKLANPKDMLNSLWIHSVGQQESSGSLASKAKREQAEEQPAEDAQPTDATSSRKCDNCFELRSPLLTADNPQMMRLNVKYSLFGAQNTRIIIHTGDLSRPLLEVRDSSINLMNEHCIPLSQPSRTQFQLFLYAEVDSTSNAYVIWKEISIAVGECTKRATDRCDFDSLSRCESVPRIGSINEFRSSLERSPVGFPLYDHTRHSPKSAFVYAQQSQKISKHFLLQEYSYDSNYCLSFWYTSGTTVSSAPNRLNGRLSIKPFDSFAHRHVKFESAVNRALEWQLVAFQVKGVEYDSLEIEAQFDGEQELLIALDDLLLERGACKLGFDCDFDLYDPLYGMCGWHVKFGDTLQPNLTPPKWLRMVAKQIDSESFPVNDFDRNSATIQGFMFASLAPNDRRSVRMQSPLISIAREGRCLCFAYFAPTRSKLVLQIHLEQGAARRKVISFQPNATVRNDWHLVKVDLAPFNAVQPASTATKTQDNGDGDDDDSSDEEDDVQTDGFNDDWSMVVIEAVNSDLLTPKPRLDAIDNSIAIDDIHLLDLPCAEYERGYDQISLQDLYDPIHDLYDEEEEDGDSWNNNSSSSDSSRSNGK